MALDNGYDFIYNPHGGSFAEDKRAGSHAKIIRPLTNKDLDLSLCGNMYRVEFDDGFITDIPAFDVIPHIDEERLLQHKEEFDDYYAQSCRDVRNRLVAHFFDSDNWTTQQIEEITGKYIYSREGFEDYGDIDIPKYTNDEGDFDWIKFEEDEGYISLETFDSEYLDDLLMTNSDFDLQTLIKFAEEFNVDLSGIEVPFKLIILHDGPYRLWNDYPKIQDMLEHEENLPLYMINKYIVCSNKEDLVEKWKDAFRDSEDLQQGSWYGVKDGEGLVIGGSFDPSDIVNIEEEIPTYITEYVMKAKLSALLDKEDMYSYSIKENIGDAENCIIGEYDAETQRFNVTCSYTANVTAYTVSGAIAKAEDSFAHADFGNLKDIVLSNQFEFKGSHRYEKSENRMKEAKLLTQSAKNGIDAIVQFQSAENPQITYAAVIEKDEYLDNVFNFLIKTKSSADNDYKTGKVIGKIYDLYDVKDVAEAIKSLREETAIISSDKGHKSIKELLRSTSNQEKEIF